MKDVVGIVGVGHVGSHCGVALGSSGTCNKMILVDKKKDVAIAQRDDILDAMVFFPKRIEVVAGELEDLGEADIIIISIGLQENISSNRLDELKGSLLEVEGVVKGAIKGGFDGIFVVITNPVDIVTYFVREISGFPKHRVIGTGTGLDTARFRQILGRNLGVDSRSVEAVVIGEHGDSQVPVFSSGRVGGVPLSKVVEEKGLNIEDIHREVMERGWKIFSKKGSTEFGIGYTCNRLVQGILGDEKVYLPASGYLDGEYGVSGVYTGTLCKIGREGVEDVVEVEVDDRELKKLRDSLEVIEKHIKKGREILGL